MPNPFGARVREALKPLTLRRLGRSIHWRVSAQDRCGKAFHFVQLRAELQEDQVHASGFELAEAIRADARSAHVPIIALSSLTSPATIERGRQAGFHDFVAKFDRQGLIAALKETTVEFVEAA